ncbi:MAG: sodium:solute symporter [Flavobacteriales bacterium]|nr:sodium:solute symporter [Flavobacteriales bacterium]
MNALAILGLIAGYFVILMLIARATSRNESNSNFFLAGKSAPWFLVAFGMIGASLSGITFISIPGKVGIQNEAGEFVDQFSYMQMVLGYLVGYLFIAFVLMPIYYRLQVTSIYTYLEQRFHFTAYKVGAFYFLVSRTIGASIRLLLVANVLQEFVFKELGIPFEVTVALSILLIWIYTHRGGIKTIIWTDTLQTLFMLVALGWSMYLLSDALGLAERGMVTSIAESQYGQWFFFNDAAGNPHFFWKEFLGGIFICIGMTGMDQDMMQKNLACKNIRQAQLNMVSFSVVLFVVNALFLGLGALLFMYAEQEGMELITSSSGKVRTDLLFPTIALRGDLGIGLSVVFLLGLIAAAYSSADSALTSLTTSVCVDFRNILKKPEQLQVKIRKQTHVIMSGVLFIVILILHYTLDLSAIGQLIFLAGFTYGPLIGFFLFGIFTKRKVRAELILAIAIVAPLLTYVLFKNSGDWFNGFNFGALHIVLNSVITFVLLMVASFVPTPTKVEDQKVVDQAA